MKLTITNARLVDCEMGFPPTALSVVPVEGHEMFAQSISGNQTFKVQFLGYQDDLRR